LRSSTILARSNFAAWITGPTSGIAADHFAKVAQTHGLNDHEAWIDALATLLLTEPVNPSERSEVLSRARAESEPSSRHALIVRKLLSMPAAQFG
jgi:hypothetical protein